MSRTADLRRMPIALVIGLLLASLLVPLITTPVKADPGWLFQTLDSATDVRAGMSSSIALDSSGNPHISYTYYNTTFYTGDLKYASYNGTAWNTETVASGPVYPSGPDYRVYTTSLALDSTDRPHISFYNNTDGSYKYASYNGTAWQIQTIESGLSGGGTDMVSSIAVDSIDNPHVSLWHSVAPASTKYASYNGTAWNIETVTDLGFANSLALDSFDVPHISYNEGAGGHHLGYATYNGTDWNTTIVDPVTYTGRYSSIAIDSNDYPHISHTYQTSGTFISDLKYAYKDASGWHNQTVDSAGDVGLYTSLALDGFDHPHISYLDNTNHNLKYAWYDGSAWNIEIVDNQYISSGNSIALDRCGYPRISYHLITDPGTFDNGELKYAYFVPAPGMAVSKGGSPVSKLGDNITYWVNITNTGDVPLQKVSVTDSLVAGIDSLFSATLPAGASENRTYIHTVQAGDPNPLLNTVTAVYGDAYGGACFSNLSVSDNHSVTLVNPGISVTKSGPAISKIGDDAIFTITIENTGDCPLIRYSVSDNLSVSPDPNTYAPFASIPASSSVSGNFTYTVQDTDPDPLSNTVIVHYHPLGLPNDYSDNATCIVDLRHPDILVTKGVAAGIYKAGDTITYLVRIDNTSTDITLVKDSITDSLAEDITSLFSDNITVGGSDNHTYTYTVKTTDPDPLLNDVTVHYHPEGLPNDITDSTYATVFLAPTITSVTPDEGSQVQTLNITITGSQLNRVNAVNFGAGITVNSFTVDSATQISANVKINASAALGTRDVTVTNPGGSDTLTDGFTVKQSSSMTSSNPRSSPTPTRPTSSAISLQYINVHPNQAHAGQPVTILTNVVNTGDEAGSYNVVLKINGHVEKSRMVSVGPQGTQPVEFTVTMSQPGTYTVDIGSQRGNFVVTDGGTTPGVSTATGPLTAAVAAVIVILAGLLIIVARKRFQGY